LKRASDNGRKPVKRIVFEGERFAVMAVRSWWDKVLGRVCPSSKRSFATFPRRL
jgi:hypothetical protein